MQQARSWKILGPIGLAILAILALLSSCAGTSQGGGGTPVTPAPNTGFLPNSISVSGFGEASGAPDVAYVMLGVNVVNADVGRAVSEGNERMQAVHDAMLAAGIAEEDLQTVGYNVYPEDRYDPQTGTPTGERIYHVDQSLNVKVRDLAKVGEIVSAGLDAGANMVAGLSFAIDDMDALEAEARTDAVENARARAQQLAGALGVTLGDAIYVTEGGGYIPPVYYPQTGFGMGGGMDAAMPAPVSPGQLTVSISVSVVFAIGPSQ
jgi:uncharacterized protein YggE